MQLASLLRLKQKSNEKTKILLNVYDLSSNSFLSTVGLGIYHSGVEINGYEFSYSNAGITISTPGLFDQGQFREQIELGTFERDLYCLENIFVYLCEGDFRPGNYNIINNNCNHFTNTLSTMPVDKEMPPWINRIAGLGYALLPRSVYTANKSQLDSP